MIKKLTCFLFVVSAVFVTAGAEDNKSEPIFSQDGSIVSNAKKLYLDKYGIPHLEVPGRVKLIFNSHVHLDTRYLTPEKLTRSALLKNQRYKMTTFSSEFSEIHLSYMSELHLKESGEAYITTLLSIPPGYKVKYAILRCNIIPQNSSQPVFVSSGGRIAELKKASKGYRRIFNQINKLVFFPDNPDLSFSLKSKTPFTLVEEKHSYYLHFSLRKPCVLEIVFNDK